MAWGEPVLATVAGEAALDVDCTVDAISRAIECHEEPVASVVDFVAPGLRESLPKLAIVPAQHLLPRRVADQLDEIRRRDDVREHALFDRRAGAT